MMEDSQPYQPTPGCLNYCPFDAVQRETTQQKVQSQIVSSPKVVQCSMSSLKLSCSKLLEALLSFMY